LSLLVGLSDHEIEDFINAAHGRRSEGDLFNEVQLLGHNEKKMARR
jgi:hypothetical protein